MSDLLSISLILIATGVAGIIGLFLIKTFFGALADYLEETRRFRNPIKPKNRVIIFFKKQTPDRK